MHSVGSYSHVETVVFVQVLTSTQATHVLLHAEPESPIKELLLDCLAQRHDFASKADIIANTTQSCQDKDWDCILSYFDSVSPYAPLQAGYVPISNTATIRKPSVMTMY